MTNVKMEELTKTALEVRKDVVRMLGVARSHGLESALTVADILVFLYWNQMKASPAEKNNPRRDRFVLGKDSALPTLYACLAHKGYFAREELWSYRRLGSMLQGHPDIRTPGIDASGGLFGGCVGVSVGLCLGMAMEGLDAKVFGLIGDAEFGEGAVWEGIQSASRNRLGRLVLFVALETGNPSQHADSGNDASLSVKLESFGWSVYEVNGHDFSSLQRPFDNLSFDDGHPKAVIARTNNGRGGNRPVSKDDIEQVLSILDSESQRSRSFS